jgi:hypothetical protein
VATVHLRSHRVEIDEPTLEQLQRLQRLIHPSVQLDLRVQRAQDLRDRLLFGKRRKAKVKRLDLREVDRLVNCTAGKAEKATIL